ncbi:hypothetical protein WJ0W_006219 [Paenibacillus melissococcoides]|uniref:Uncharacterized protein n=1 Tax=Paenibacillus melissococcoides TaxID=2912268 RepID=A0ABN8UCV4_9BACL|nr:MULTISPECIES: hypothetical protein [Paenibacillus]GIO82383.1 hypothetical protein J6TS7_59930 [Paenibacillus dendritiformis]CAH8249032.1 hypothetical protein WJ0W_006219 [Paenibacillus melissococcoides]
MEKETVQKIEETAVKLLDWIQNQVDEGLVCMEGPHPLPEMVKAVAKLIEALKGIGEKYGRIDLNVDEFARTVEEAFNRLEGQPPIGGFVKPETLVNKDYKSPYYGAGLYTGSVTGKIMDEQRIREIVREELAAQKEQLTDAVKQSLHIDATDFLVATDGMLRGTSE